MIAYQADFRYALGCRLGDTDGIMRIRSVRRLDDRHHLSRCRTDWSIRTRMPCVMLWFIVPPRFPAMSLPVTIDSRRRTLPGAFGELPICLLR
jgi:hypothetical protein